MRVKLASRCSEEFLMYYNSKHIRKYIRQRDYCECSLCGEYDPRFQIDHIRPLYEQKYKQPHEVDWSYWDEKNLQTLCRKCHKEKTKKDMENLKNLMKKTLDMNMKKVLYLGMIKGDNMISKKLVSDITNKIEQHHKLYRFPVKAELWEDIFDQSINGWDSSWDGGGHSTRCCFRG